MDKKKTEDMPVETTHEVDMPKKEEKTDRPRYRYVCEACSGVAFYAPLNNRVQMTPATCQTCFAPLGIIKTENFIKL
jgi:predicted SprT family Zn-dependent metalloprotease